MFRELDSKLAKLQRVRVSSPVATGGIAAKNRKAFFPLTAIQKERPLKQLTGRLSGHLKYDSNLFYCRFVSYVLLVISKKIFFKNNQKRQSFFLVNVRVVLIGQMDHVTNRGLMGSDTVAVALWAHQCERQKHLWFMYVTLLT